MRHLCGFARYDAWRCLWSSCFVVGSMSLRCQLLSIGFVAGAERLNSLLHFLEEQGVEKLEDLIGCPSLASENGAALIRREDIVFLVKVLLVH